MCIEKDLARSESIGRYISVLHRYSRMEIGRQLAPYGIGPGQFPFLMHLHHHGGVSHESISAHMRYDKATVTRAIKKLEARGYVSRHPDPTDHRVLKVSLTDKGEKVVDEVKEALKNNSEMLLEGFTPEQRSLLLELMAKMFQNAVRHHEGGG